MIAAGVLGKCKRQGLTVVAGVCYPALLLKQVSEAPERLRALLEQPAHLPQLQPPPLLGAQNR